MPIEYQPRPELARGTGIVYLAFSDLDGMYGGYWDLGPEGPAPLDECPRTASAIEAVRWGRERARIVMIRPENDQAQYYWAGVGPPNGEYANLPVWHLPGNTP